MADRRIRLELIRLQGRCIRVGRNRASGPTFYLASYDHARDTFATVNSHNGTRGTLAVDDLHSALTEGIAHVSKVGGIIFV